MAKLKTRGCAKCRRQFKPSRITQVYCSDECRDVAKALQRRGEVGERYCAWCGDKMPESMRSHAIYCSNSCRSSGYRLRPCIYCGMPADSKDHFIPKAFVFAMQDIGVPKQAFKTVPACRECNCTAGAKVFPTIGDKRRYIQDRYRKKYAKILKMPSWTEKEVEALGPTLKSHVMHSINAKATLKQRLRWPRR